MRTQICTRALLLLCLLPAGVYAQDQGIAPSQAPASAAPSTHPGSIHVGGNVMMAKLISHAMPVYPQIAKQAHISGTVVLHAIVGKDGAVQDLQYISGPPLLMKAAMDAVRQWRYEPVLLNGEPVTVDTTVSVVFQLGDSGAASSTPSSKQSGQTAAATPASALSLASDPQFQTDVRQLLEVTHYKDVSGAEMRMLIEPLKVLMTRTLPAIPKRDEIIDAYVDKLGGLVASEEDIANVTATYAKYLTDDDVKGLIQFYQTAAGQHFNDVKLQLRADLGRVELDLVHAHLPEIYKQLCDEYSELRDNTYFCGGDPGKKSLLRNPNPFANGN